MEEQSEKIAIRIIKKEPVKKQSSVKSFFASIIFGLVFAGLFSGALYVFATPPGSQYAPGETLNPSCSVGDANCSVSSPVPYSGATAAVDLGSKNFTTTGTITAGTLKVGSTFTFPTSDGTSGQVLTTDGAGGLTWASAASGANTALSNLSSVAINAALVPGTAGALNVGSATKPWADVYFAGTSSTPGTNNFKITGASTSGTRTITFPDASGTATLLGNSSTGSGSVVLTTSPTLVTPTLGAALATSINGLTLTSSTGTLTIANSKVATVNNTLTFSGTDGSTLNVGGGGTLGSNAYTSTAYAPLASPTFTGTVTIPTPFTLGATSVTSTGTQLNYLNAATGTTGTTSTNLVFSTSPTLTTPNIGAATGTSVALTNTSGAQATLKYDSSNYTALTAASNGDLTLATTSGSSGGQINLTSAITGDFTLLSNSGTLVLGGTGNTNNENLKLDFETSSNTVAVTSGTGVTAIDLGSLNLVTTGALTLGGSTTGTLVTRVKAGAASESDANGSLVVDSTNGRLYFRYGSAWHYVAQTAGFQIPDFETVDPISGDQIKEGDLVLGMINQTFEDKALHGVWVKWDSVKAELLKELKGQGGAITPMDLAALNSASTSGGTPDTLLGKVTNALFSLGVSVENGLTTIKNLATNTFSAKTARIDKLEMVDSATGDIYCTWVENGDWKKAKGECGSVQVAVAASELNQQSSDTVKQAAQVAATQAAQQAADQAGQQAVNQVKDQISHEVQSQVQAQVQTEVQNQLQAQQPAPEPTPAPQPAVDANPPVDQTPAPDNTTPAPEVVPDASQSAPASVDAMVQQSASALLLKAGSFARWFADAVTPASIKDSSALLSAGAQGAIDGLMNVFQTLGGFISKAPASVTGNVKANNQIVSDMLKAPAAGLLQFGTAAIDNTLYIEGNSQDFEATTIDGLRIIPDALGQFTTDMVDSIQVFGFSVDGYHQLYFQKDQIISEVLSGASLALGEKATNSTLYIEGAFQQSTASLIVSPLGYMVSDTWRLLKDSFSPR